MLGKALTVLLAALATGAVLASPVRAQGIQRAVDALRNDPVYVDPAAEHRLGAAEQERLRARITSRGAGPMYIAVLPKAALAEAGGDPATVAEEIANELGRRGTYAVVVGNSFRAGATDLRVGKLADEAARAHAKGGVLATLLDFVDRVGAARKSGGDPGARNGGAPSSGGGRRALAILAAIVGGIVGLLTLRNRRRRRAEFEPVRRATEEDLLALADDIRALDLDVEMPGVDPKAKEDYAQALRQYERADGALDRADRTEELEVVTSALEEGRFAMTSAKARLEGRLPPERRPPCFFDPRHGPSTRDVEWAPPGGAPRLVPACEADAQAVDRGLEPRSREVLVGGQTMPYWSAPAYFGPWAGGYFGGFGGLSGFFPGLLLGEMLGGGFGGATYGDGGGDIGGGDIGGGDLGSGDLGGGDLGDLGGGDLGGGDFGGGDFGGDGGGGDF